jgi:hypothetical protein
MNLVGKKKPFCNLQPHVHLNLIFFTLIDSKIENAPRANLATHGLQILVYGAKSKAHFEELHKASFHMI